MTVSVDRGVSKINQNTFIPLSYLDCPKEDILFLVSLPMYQSKRNNNRNTRQ